MKRKYIYLVDDHQYPIIAKLVKGSFMKCVTERSNKENSAVVKFWRAKGTFEIKDSVFMYNGKKVSLEKGNF